jgi:hypothetical protein
MRLPMGEWLLSRRDSAIVAIRRAIAAHGEPGSKCLGIAAQKSRPVGYG